METGKEPPTTQEMARHIHHELIRYWTPSLGEIQYKLQEFLRLKKNPLDYVLVEELFESRDQTMEVKLIWRRKQ